jgi:excisionase family DNA binding protein
MSANQELSVVYMRPADAARALGVSRASVWRWIREGRLAEVRLGRRTTRVAVPRCLVDGTQPPDAERTGNVR